MSFVSAALDADDDRTMSELCRQFGVSRKTGYKLVRRFEEGGVEGLKDRSRAPWSHPNATPSEVEALVVQARLEHPRWGPRKLVAWLARRNDAVAWPSPSTVGQILKRQGLVEPRKRKRRTEPYIEPFSETRRPNDVWSSDFKGWFWTGDGRQCHPLTTTDAYSRKLLMCRALPGTKAEQVRPWFEYAFKKYGLPLAIRTDNGSPFASRAVGGLTRLSAWWVSLGIRHERIEPGKPQQNGRHERMHRTLKQETASPPRASLRAQQRAFARFEAEYNFERPHEALDYNVPGDLYEPSGRLYRRHARPIEYPAHMTIRSVRTKGAIKWRGDLVYLSEALVGYRVGLEQVTDRHWEIYFNFVPLGVLDAQTLRVVRPSPTKKGPKR